MPADAVTSSSVRASGVVFDMGGVLTVDPYQGCLKYADELQLPPTTFADLLSTPEFHEVETGHRTMRDFLKFGCTIVTDRYGVAVDIRRLAAAFTSGQEFRPEMSVLVHDLAVKGVRLALLTNNVKEARSWWTSGVFPLEEFSVVLDSSEVGLRKPDPKVFLAVADRMGCAPEHLVFFDDTEANVVAAARIGMQAVRFIDAQQCRRELEVFGLL